MVLSVCGQEILRIIEFCPLSFAEVAAVGARYDRFFAFLGQGASGRAPSPG
jgi:hypothetical protein